MMAYLYGEPAGRGSMIFRLMRKLGLFITVASRKMGLLVFSQVARSISTVGIARYLRSCSHGPLSLFFCGDKCYTYLFVGFVRKEHVVATVKNVSDSTCIARSGLT